jgi:hypothetical protein
MAETSEIQSDIQIDVELSKAARIACSKEMMAAMNAIVDVQSDIKDYMTDKKEEIGKYAELVDKARMKYNAEVVDAVKVEITSKIVSLLNHISQLEDDIKAYQTEKKAEIAKFEAIVNINRSKINRGKDTQWVNVTIKKNFKDKIKTYVRNDTGEVVKEIPLTEDDLQMTLEDVE